MHLADYRGRPAIVYFWASWCLPCREEFPLLAAAQSKHASQGLAVLGVIYKDNADDARTFMSAHGGAWPALEDPDGSVASTYKVLAAPMSFYVDRSGVVRAINFGPPSSGESLDKDLAKIL